MKDKKSSYQHFCI